jgi:hypothetical protein
MLRPHAYIPAFVAIWNLKRFCNIPRTLRDQWVVNLIIIAAVTCNMLGHTQPERLHERHRRLLAIADPILHLTSLPHANTFAYILV